ncbi:Protein-S-isoprenylcysteine O-methyltransferase Ste14 [Desulfocicer vacuolatum DSM 3385]|uniref:Protein-S-isoprenylcysteine O-methyltransferase Ste14 n=1 Tax=Desulfocicer vacuolatum DSM 3385 TaxID=1121400 RepID=A0A1W1YSG6_9BACT|nr:isoprenylcysteine carboxylmethyltransferase family protein [Desulfocicer vacuolatum]SMC39052.1 Protein-S-isoprenylcysteine O-methyltransferase Ste14 [Desulfocicer vacuolatum DSM 3385]
MLVQVALKNQKKDNPGVNIMPPVVFYACLIAGGVAEFFFPSFILMLDHPMVRIIGILIGSAGFIFMMCAHEKFKALGTNVPTNQSASLCVIKGAYRFSRNPMYVGGSAFFLGLGLALGSLWMIVSYFPLGIYLACYVVPKEESYMERTFKNEYLLYCEKVRRWV